MAKLICEIEGVRGRVLKLYDTKCVIITEKTLGSLITGNITDGEKTIFLCDVVGVQFKKSGALLGYLQFETPSMQMNNKSSNMFSENTFTFEEGANGVSNAQMEAVYNYVVDRLEELKYGVSIIQETPDFSVYTKAAPAVTPSNPSSLEAGGEKCELCGQYFDHLTYCLLKDDFGSRFRNICDNCMAEHNGIPK